jgi:adenylate cyclase
MVRLLRLPNRIPVRLPSRQAGQKWLAALVIAIVATLIVVGWWLTRVISQPLLDLDDLLYDSAYRLREDNDRKNGDIVIVAIDQASLTKLDQKKLDDTKVVWPWPRELYGDLVQYFDRCGAKVVAFDIIMSETDRASDQLSDETFAELVAETKVPIVFGNQISPEGKLGPFGPPIKNPDFGAVNSDGGVLRAFQPFWKDHPSLAYRAAAVFSGKEPSRKADFRMHFYGPHRRADGSTTYRYVSAFDVLAATRGAEKEAGLSPEVFRNKIVLVGGTAAGLYDDKTIPLRNKDRSEGRDLYPGVEYQATAIENLLFQDRVYVIPRWTVACITFVGAFFAAAGMLFPQRTFLKVIAATLAGVILLGTGFILFHGETIRWLPLGAPLVALLFSTVAAFAWSYFTEGRQRLFFSNAFALSTSPVIAEAIDRNPGRLKLGGERREITVMFTDLAGFTDFAEKMEVEKLVRVINFYMEAMSEEIVNQDGYLDKYIGDAIMSSWNGLLEQPDHAAQACRAALAIKRREKEITPELREMVDAPVVTRIGIHCGPMAVGNLGSSRKLSYTVLGDAVNLSARLEPANKIYGTEVMISQTIADQVKGRFILRELDWLRVKGKKLPMGVYELMGEGEPTPGQERRIELYSAGLGHYRAQRWEESQNALSMLINEYPDDGPANALLARVEEFRHDPPGADWDGVYVSKSK